MSPYSEQEQFCRACGTKFHAQLVSGYASRGCCSKDCFEEYNWRETLSIMGKDYYPQPKPPPN